MQHDCGKPDDLSFGPAIAHCYRPFDFTLWFEELVLVIIPSTLFIAGALPRLWYLHRSSTVALRDATHKAKLVFYSLLVILQCLLIVETARGKSTNTPISICAATLLTAATILLYLLCHYEHVRSVRPAALLIIFLSLTTLFDGVRIRTHFSIGNVGLVAILSIGVALKLLLLLLESKNKRHHVLERYSEKSPEEFAGPISRTFFYWLHPLLRRGYGNYLSIDDIGEIDDCLLSSSINNRLSSTGYPGKKSKCSTHGLTWVLLRCLGRNALYPIVPRLALSACTFAQPFLVNAMLNELNDHHQRDMSAGYGLIGATLLVYVGIAVSNAWYWQQINRSVTIVRGSLVILLFDKLFQLKEDSSVESRAMTLMFSDTQRIMNTLNYVHELWAGILETAIATWLLYRQTGSASFAMLGVSIVSSASCISLSKPISRKQQAWLAAVDQRLGPTKRMLSSLKAIKMLSAGERTTKALNYLRNVELRTSWPFRRLRIVTVVLSYSTMTLSPPIVFTVYMGIYPHSESLNVTKLFTSLTLISLLATPLMHLCQAIPAFGAAYGCLQRIQSFLELEEREEPRTFDFQDTLSESNENIPGQTMSHMSQDANTTIVSIKDASFGWTKSKALLKSINMDIKQGSKIAIFGRVGCGKSLLLKGLLGEAEQMAGEVKVRHDLRFAYCSQTPWLENVSVQMNLEQYATGLEDQKMLDSLVYTCSLQDLINLPDYQAGTIGSGGVKLSGGQRQRLALARSLALKRDVLLLDDVFSALDRRTRLHIAQKLLRPSKSVDLAPMTIVYATHDEQIASLADKVYEITESGTLQIHSGLRTVADTEEAIASHQDAEPSLAPRPKPQNQDENPPDAKKLLGDRVVYKTYLQSMGLVHSVLFLLIGASFAITFKFPDIWIQWWSADVSDAHPRHSTSYWMSVYGVLEILPLITLSLWIWHLFYNVVPAVGISLHGSLLQTVITASFPFISSVDTGSIINRFNQDLMLVDSLLPFDLFNTVSELFVAIIQVLFIAVASVQALAVLPVVVVVLYMIQHFYLRTSKQLRLLELEAKAVLHTKVSDVSGHSGPSMIRAHGWQDVTRKNFMRKLDASQKPLYLLFSVQRWLQLVLNLVVAGLVVIVAGVAVAVRSKVNVGAVGVAFLNASTLGETLTQFVLAWTSLETSLGAVARIALFERDTPSEQDEPSSLPDPSRSAWWPTSGEVVFDNVWATYTAGTSLQQDSDATWSLRGVSFKVRAGEHVAICGRTGSGKSTLLLALLRMVDVPMGSIYVDNIHHSQLPLNLLRKGFFVISQDVLEESVSIRQQLDPDSAFSDKEIKDVLIQCDLWRRVDLDGGLSSTATDMKLSVGETQLLSLARTLLYAGSKDGGIVILDEATSNLDRETQHKIDSLVDSRLKNKTVIAVSHRLTSALSSDRIIIMENGQIIHDAAPSYVIEHAELFSGLKSQVLNEE